MIRYAAVLFLGLLAACASASLPPEGDSLTNRYYAARLDQSNLNQTAREYFILPRCTSQLIVSCSDQGTVDKVLRALESVDASLDTVGATIDANGDVSQHETTLLVVNSALTQVRNILAAEITKRQLNVGGVNATGTRSLQTP